MKKGIFAKLSGQSSRAMLFRTVCILSGLLVVTAWSVTGVYAKYVDSASVDGYAGVGRMGIVTFELLEHEAINLSENNRLDKITDEDTINFESLYELDYQSEVLKNTYSTVIPGIDIPKDPFINLVLESNEVSYQLYVKVEKNGFPTYEDASGDEQEAIIFKLTNDWELVDEETGLYLFTGKESGVDSVFVAGTSYSFTSKDGNAIQILKDDKIKVSEKFNSEIDIRFSLTFTARLEQVLTPAGNNSTEDGAGNGD